MLQGSLCPELYQIIYSKWPKWETLKPADFVRAVVKQYYRNLLHPKANYGEHNKDRKDGPFSDFLSVGKDVTVTAEMGAELPHLAI